MNGKRGHRPPLGQAISHDRLRTELGATPPVPAAEATEPFQDTQTGRITNGAAAARRRWLKETLKAKASEGMALVQMSPERCPSWLSPHVRDAAAYATTLLERFRDPVLEKLVVDCASARAVAHALMSLGDAKSLTEARGWMREHRSSLRELAALGAVQKSNAEAEKANKVFQAALEAAKTNGGTDAC